MLNGQGNSEYVVCLARSYSATIQMKAVEQYFPVVLFIMLYKVVLTFESVDETPKYDTQMKAIELYVAVVTLRLFYFFTECVFLNQSSMIRANTVLKLHIYWDLYHRGHHSADCHAVGLL